MAVALGKPLHVYEQLAGWAKDFIEKRVYVRVRNTAMHEANTTYDLLCTGHRTY